MIMNDHSNDNEIGEGSDAFWDALGVIVASVFILIGGIIAIFL